MAPGNLLAAERLAEYAASETLASMPADVVGKAKLCILDAVGCLLGAQASPIRPMMAGFTADLCGGSRIDTGSAAFVYAMLINALDFDAIYKKGHP